MYILSEDGEIFDDSSWPIKEFVDGKWQKRTAPITLGTLMNGRVLTDDELALLIKTGKRRLNKSDITDEINE